jgi:pimeloyl-ACP methyl ester carboxylesterase
LRQWLSVKQAARKKPLAAQWRPPSIATSIPSVGGYHADHPWPEPETEPQMNDRLEQQHVESSDGRRLTFAEYGDPSGTPVIYCHGFPGSRLEARLADGPARELGIRLIAPDRPGFGLSTFQPNRRIADWPADLACIADHLELRRFRVLGVSGGAPYALAGAAALGARIERVTLACGLGEITAPNDIDGMNVAAGTALRFQRRFPKAGHWTYHHIIGPTLRRFPAWIFKILVGHATAADREVLAEGKARRIIIDSFAEAFRQGTAGPAHEVRLITEPWDLDLLQVRQPVSLWHGEADRTVPVAMGRRHAAMLPQVVAHYLPGEGHFSLIVRHMRVMLEDLIR